MRLFEGTPFDRPPRCERCDELEEDCQCPPEKAPRTPPEKQIARVGSEKRKKGKFVPTVRDLVDEGDHLPELLTALKSACGAGGTLRDGVLELQGDRREQVSHLLRERGYRVR